MLRFRHAGAMLRHIFLLEPHAAPACRLRCGERLMPRYAADTAALICRAALRYALRFVLIATRVYALCRDACADSRQPLLQPPRLLRDAVPYVQHAMPCC